MELRLKHFQLHEQPWLKRIATYIEEGGEYEIKILSVISDGVNDGQLHLNLDVIPVKESGSHYFGPYGLALYRAPRNTIPDFLDAHVTVLESDDGIRTVASLMDKAVQTEEYQSLMATVATLVANPYAPAISIAKELFGIAMMVMKGNSDDLWMQLDCSFTKEYGEYKDFSYKNDRLGLDFIFK